MCVNVLPVNSTFLSSMLYEGYLRYRLHEDLCNAFNTVRDYIKAGDRVPRPFFPVHRNDRTALGRLLNWSGRDFFEDDLITAFNNVCSRYSVQDDSLEVVIKRTVMLIGGKRAQYAAPQFLKADRYTGLNNLFDNLVTQQIKIQLAPETYLLGLIGLYSSYVVRNVREGMYYMLTFAPDTTIMLIDADPDKLDTYFSIKNAVADDLRKILSETTFLESWILELLMNTSISAMLYSKGLDKISLILFKLAFEGGRAYKIYETNQVEIYKDIPCINILRNYTSNPYSVIENLHEFISNIARRVGRPDSKEYSNLINALHGLYEFVVLGNPVGFHVFSREIADSYEKLKDENPRIASMYRGILRKLSYSI